MEIEFYWNGSFAGVSYIYGYKQYSNWYNKTSYNMKNN